MDTYVLVARIRSLLRRTTYGPVPAPEQAPGEEPQPAGEVLTFGDLTVDTAGMEVFVAGSPVALTPPELKLLLAFAVPGRGAPWLHRSN